MTGKIDVKDHRDPVSYPVNPLLYPPAARETAAPFDPHAPGTSEASWSGVLGNCGRWTPPDTPLVVVSPHPDDEVLGAGGLLHTWAASGRSVTVVSVTDGEAAYQDWPALGSVRREELQAALRKLAPTHIAAVRLGIPDGRIQQHRNRLRNSLLSLLDSKVTLVAPYERDGHPDHDAVGEVCGELARSHDLVIARYLIWRWHHGDPQTFKSAPWGKFPLSIDARRAKAHAVQCFESQLRPHRGRAIIPWHVLRHFERPYEAFLL